MLPIKRIILLIALMATAAYAAPPTKPPFKTSKINVDTVVNQAGTGPTAFTEGLAASAAATTTTYPGIDARTGANTNPAFFGPTDGTQLTIGKDSAGNMDVGIDFYIDSSGTRRYSSTNEAPMLKFNSAGTLVVAIGTGGSTNGTVSAADVMDFSTTSVSVGGVSAVPVTITDTTGGGGNVPHACTVRNSGSANTTSRTETCNSGERVFGGGCNSVSPGTLLASYPSASNVWTCTSSSSANMTAYAICCIY